MGTSQSSNGPGPGVPLVPPWADEVDSATPLDDETPPEDQDKEKQPELVAPRGRFRAARRGIGAFAHSGDNHNLRRALSHYVRTGYGGAGTMSRRLGGTAANAGRLNGVLQSGRAPDGTLLRDVALARGSDVNVVLDAIVDAASPANGTQDRESSRRAIRAALADLLIRFPDADLVALTDAQREFVIERYVALDVYGRFCLDLQKTVVDKAPDPATGLRRLRQVREFIYQQVAAAFRAIRGKGATTANVARLTAQALRDTLSVFEEYTR
jgi:hypothetical protein